MAGNCNLPITNEAYNYGISEVKKMYIQTKDLDASLAYAIEQIDKKYPDNHFDPKSFSDKVTKGLSKKNARYKSKSGKGKGKKSSEEKIKELVNKIKNKEFKPKSNKEKKTSSLTERQKDLRNFVNNKYGKKLSDESFLELISDTEALNEIEQQYAESSKEKADAVVKKKVEELVNKIKGLSDNKKKELARKMTEKFYEDGILDSETIKNFYAEALGLPHNSPELNKQIDEVVKDRKEVDAIEKEIEEAVKGIKSGNKDQKQSQAKVLATAIQKHAQAVKNSNQSKAALAKSLQAPRFWLWNVGPMITLNLMAPKTLSKNITGMGVDAIFRNLSGLISTPMASWLLKKNLIGARWKGANIKKALTRFKDTMKTGQVPSHGADIDAYDYLNSIDNLKETLNSLKDKEGKEAVMNALAFVFKFHPDMIKRILGSSDYAVYSMIEDGELYRIGKEKGLSGPDLDAFLAKPDEASKKRAEDRAKEFTLKGDVPKILEPVASFTPEKYYESRVAKGVTPMRAKIEGGLLGILKALTVPFIKSSYNLFKLAFKITLPEYRAYKGISNYYKYKKQGDNERAQVEMAEATGDFAIGMAIRYVAIQMVMNGAISAGYDDDDEKTKEAIYKVAGGPNKINTTALWRGLMGGDFTPKEGDDWRDLSSVGILGLSLGAYAQAYHGMSQEDIKKETNYAKDLNNIWKVPSNAAISELQTGMDMPFLTGYNQIVDMFKSGGSSKKVDKYLANSLKTLMTGVFPSTHQQLSRSVTGEIYSSYDKEKTLSENVFDAFGYNFFFDKNPDIKKKIASLSPSQKETIKTKEYHLFDNYLGRMLFNMDPFSTTETTPSLPIVRLYDEAMKESAEDREKLFPTVPSDKVNIGKRNKPVYVKLTPEQYEFYQQQASMLRMMYASPYIMSPDFQSGTTEEKQKVLQGLYLKGLTQAKIHLKSKYPMLKQAQMDEGESPAETKKMLKKWSNALD